MADNDKVFPGNIDRYRSLRDARDKFAEQHQQDGAVDPNVFQAYVLLNVAEELAGLAYILDGIRYSTRKQG